MLSRGSKLSASDLSLGTYSVNILLDFLLISPFMTTRENCQPTTLTLFPPDFSENGLG